MRDVDGKSIYRIRVVVVDFGKTKVARIVCRLQCSHQSLRFRGRHERARDADGFLALPLNDVPIIPKIEAVGMQTEVAGQNLPTSPPISTNALVADRLFGDGLGAAVVGDAGRARGERGAHLVGRVGAGIAGTVGAGLGHRGRGTPMQERLSLPPGRLS